MLLDVREEQGDSMNPEKQENRQMMMIWLNKAQLLEPLSTQQEW